MGGRRRTTTSTSNFLHDAASRLCLSVTYGSPKASDLPGEKRAASSVLTAAAANRFYSQDDVAAKAKAGEKPKGDSYTPRQTGARRSSWLRPTSGMTSRRTGHCVDVVAGMVVDSSGL